MGPLWCAQRSLGHIQYSGRSKQNITAKWGPDDNMGERAKDKGRELEMRNERET